jgi:PAS domain S-box-containing protein
MRTGVRAGRIPGGRARDGWCARGRRAYTRDVSRLEEIGGDIPDALERVNVPSYVIDEYGIVRWLNPAARKLVGDVRGHQFSSVVAPEDTRRARQAFARHMVGSEDVDGSVVLVDQHGTRVSAEVSSVCLFSGHRVIGVFGQLSDVEITPEPPRHPHLTPRQREVLHLLEHGRSTEQIARELHLSIETVRNHVRAILRALDVHSRLEAVAVARRDLVSG